MTVLAPLMVASKPMLEPLAFSFFSVMKLLSRSLSVKVSLFKRRTASLKVMVTLSLRPALAPLAGLKVTVGAVLSNVTLPPPLVIAVPAFPAELLNAILYVTDPSVSKAFAV